MLVNKLFNNKISLTLFVLTILYVPVIRAQTALTDYKTITVETTGAGDYTRSLILLHEIYNGVTLNGNYAIGTITAMRGHHQAYNRTNIVKIFSSSAYNETVASLSSVDNNGSWQLMTCSYNGKKYLALDVPYADSYHDHGFKFAGWIFSTGESLKSIVYESAGQPVNTTVLSDIQNFSAEMTERHAVKNFTISGNLGVGTEAPTEKLSVNGKIRAKEVKVEVSNWPDYVFREDYQLIPLKEVAKFINTTGHLPDMPSSAQVHAEGISLGDMNKLLLKKIEELTLHLIEKDKQLDAERTVNLVQDKRLKDLEKILLPQKLAAKN